jgi:outer membrane protein OmpA-like peptidoglycan-associated protein
VLFAYNGNVLLDNASALVVVSCDNNEPVAANDKKPGDRVNTPPTKPEPAPSPKEPVKPQPTNPAPNAPANGSTTFNETLKGSDMQVGQTFQMTNLYFPADSSTPRPISFKELDKLYDFLVANPKISIEVGGHTNNVPNDAFCDDLSTRRAKSVADYLIKKGMAPDRIKYKGYGKRNPIADNSTDAGRKKNQRVEIKILKIE